MRAFVRLVALVSSLVVYVSYFIIRSYIKSPSIERSFRFRRAWVRLAMKILNLKVEEITGSIPDYPALYVINHRNLIDPVIIAQMVDVFFIAKAEVESYPFLGKGAALTGVIYVKREIQDSRTAARITLNETLQKGLSVGVYPEGTTGTEELTIKFHRGSFDEAAKLGIPVIPIAAEFKNKSDLWIQPSLFKQFLIQFGKKRTRVKVEIHPPLMSNDGQFLMEESQKLINGSLKSMHKNWSDVWN